jgi:hypothetical protein
MKTDFNLFRLRMVILWMLSNAVLVIVVFNYDPTVGLVLCIINNIK